MLLARLAHRVSRRDTLLLRLLQKAALMKSQLRPKLLSLTMRRPLRRKWQPKMLRRKRRMSKRSDKNLNAH